MEDLPELARHLLARCRRTGKPGDDVFAPDALRALETHCWPGNVRELANVIEHAAILCDDGPISSQHLPANFSSRRLRVPHFKTLATLTLREVEMQCIQQSLERHGGNKPKAAEELGISLKTLYNKLNQVNQLEQSA
jgi:two-component system NtrC family response regulator